MIIVQHILLDIFSCNIFTKSSFIKEENIDQQEEIKSFDPNHVLCVTHTYWKHFELLDILRFFKKKLELKYSNMHVFASS